MKITYTNAPVNQQKKSNASIKAIAAMSCVIALMVAIKVIYSPNESMEDVAAMANSSVISDESESEENTEAIQTSVLYLSEISYDKKGESASVFLPLKGRISSGYEERLNPFGTGESEFHRGVDIVPEENRNIIAYTDGVVVMADYDDSYGNFVKIKHKDGLETIYAHCSQLNVEKGEEITAGQIIAVTGNTGDSTGEHLHFEVRKNGVAVDPMPYLQ